MNPLYLYRIVNNNNKISGMRPLVYTLLGYAVSGRFLPFSQSLNLLAISGILATGNIVNDYFDWKLLGERNYTGLKKLSVKQFILFSLLPLSLWIFYILIVHKGVLTQLFILLLITLYSIPPLRLKEKKFISLVLPPFIAPILFLQGLQVCSSINMDIVMLAILIFLFHIHIEGIHILEDILIPEETKKITSFKKTKKFMVVCCSLDILLSLIFSFWNPIFINSMIFSLIRLLTLKNISPENIYRIRRNPLLPCWGIYELIIYAILGISGCFYKGGFYV